jgi:hypothetical protein
MELPSNPLEILTVSMYLFCLSASFVAAFYVCVAWSMFRHFSGITKMSTFLLRACNTKVLELLNKSVRKMEQDIHPDPTFHPFFRLPLELQCMIWKFAFKDTVDNLAKHRCLSERTVITKYLGRINGVQDVRRTTCRSIQPPIFHVSRNSRLECLRLARAAGYMVQIPKWKGRRPSKRRLHSIFAPDLIILQIVVDHPCPTFYLDRMLLGVTQPRSFIYFGSTLDTLYRDSLMDARLLRLHGKIGFVHFVLGGFEREFDAWKTDMEHHLRHGSRAAHPRKWPSVGWISVGEKELGKSDWRKVECKAAWGREDEEMETWRSFAGRGLKLLGAFAKKELLKHI